MTIHDVVRNAAMRLALTQELVREVFERIVQEIGTGLETDGVVSLSSFGVLRVEDAPPKGGKIHADGDLMLPEGKAVTLRPGPALRRRPSSGENAGPATGG